MTVVLAVICGFFIGVLAGFALTMWGVACLDQHIGRK